MKNKQLWAVFALSILIYVQLGAPSNVAACSCPAGPKEAQATLTAEFYANEADAIFQGKVIGIDVRWYAVFSDHWMRKTALFEVTSIWKGLSQSQVILDLSEQCCGWIPFHFSVGETYLVYVKVQDNGRWRASYWTGTQPIADAQTFLQTLGNGKPPLEITDLRASFYLPACSYFATFVGLIVVGYFLRAKRRKAHR
jgi:hypothetical protein